MASPMLGSSPLSPITVSPSSLVVDNEPRALITYSDENNLWSSVEKDFLLRLPLQKLVWKSIRGSKLIEVLPIKLKRFHESILPRSALYSTVTPILHLYFLNCEDTEQYRNISKQKIKDWLSLFSNRKDQEWFIVYIGTSDSKPKFLNIKASVFDKLKSDFQKDKKDRIFLFQLLDPEKNDQEVWGEFLNKIKDGILSSFESQVVKYEQDIQRLDAQRLVPGWNFCQFFLLKEGLAQCFASISLLEDASIQYEELEVTHYQTLNSQIASFSTFGGQDQGDDLLPSSLFSKTSPKDFRSLLLSNQISIFDFRFHLIRQQLNLHQQQHQVYLLLKRSFSFLYQFRLTLIDYKDTVPSYFQHSFILSFVDAVLTLSNSMLLQLKPTTMKDQHMLIHSVRLDLILLACAQLNEIGSKVHQLHLYLETASPSSSSSSESNKNIHSLPPKYTKDQPFKDIDPKLSNSTCIQALRDFDSFIQVMEKYLLEGRMAAKLGQKFKLGLYLKTKLADLRFVQGHYEEASQLYKEIAQTYSDAGWLSIDRSLLLRLARAYQHLNQTRSYIITSLQLMASMISQMQFTFSLETMTLDLNELKRQSEHLNAPATMKFAPLFQTILPPILHSTLKEPSKMALTQVMIQSHLPISFPMDSIAITFIGGETSDVVFKQLNVVLHPGENPLTMVWETPSTSGEYVAEKISMKAGQLIFINNLIKENRKHTLQIHEPPGPLSLSLGLPDAMVPNLSRICVRIASLLSSTLIVPQSWLSIRLFSNDTHLEAIKYVLSTHPDSIRTSTTGCTGSSSSSNPMKISDPLPFLTTTSTTTKKVALPSFQGSLTLLLCLTTSMSSVSLKAVLEYMVSQEQEELCTVSITESIAFMPLPIVETEYQVVDPSKTFVLLTMINPFTSPLCIDESLLVLDNGEASCSHRVPTCLMANQKLTTCYEITKIPPDGRLEGKVCVHHHYRREDALYYIKTQFQQELQTFNLDLYLSSVWPLLQEHVESILLDDLILKGQQTLPPLPSSIWTRLIHVPTTILKQLQKVTLDLFDRLQPLHLHSLPSVPSRMAEYVFTLTIPSHHLEYQYLIDTSKKRMVGHPIPCTLSITHQPPRWVTSSRSTSFSSSSSNSPLTLYFDLDLSSQMWLVLGPKRKQFVLEMEQTVQFDFALVPVVSGTLPLPLIQFYPSLPKSSLRPLSITFNLSSIQSFSPLFDGLPAFPFSVSLIGPQPCSLTVQPELVSTVVVMGHHVIGMQRKHGSNPNLLTSLPKESKVGSILDMRRTSQFLISSPR